MSSVSLLEIIVSIVAPIATYGFVEIFEFITSRKEQNPLRRCILDLGVTDLSVFLGLLILFFRTKATEPSPALIAFLLYLFFMSMIGVYVHLNVVMRIRVAAVISAGLVLCSAGLKFYVLECDVYEGWANPVLLMMGILLTIVGIRLHTRK
mgnify:CR=1 FL=1